MSEKIPVQDTNETFVEVDVPTTPEVRESLKTAELDDFAPEIIEKAQLYKDKVSNNKKERLNAESLIKTINQEYKEQRAQNEVLNDERIRDRRDAEKILRQTDKSDSVVRSELLNADDNLMRAERQLFNEFMNGVEGINSKSSPERVIGVFDDKFANLEASISEANTYIEEHRKAYGLNTRRAYEDPILGPKMQERDELQKELTLTRAAWVKIGGEGVEKAREMLSIKRAFDLLEQKDPQPNSPEDLSEIELNELAQTYVERFNGVSNSSVEYAIVAQDIFTEITASDLPEEAKSKLNEIIVGLLLDNKNEVVSAPAAPFEKEEQELTETEQGQEQQQKQRPKTAEEIEKDLINRLGSFAPRDDKVFYNNFAKRFKESILENDGLTDEQKKSLIERIDAGEFVRPSKRKVFIKSVRDKFRMDKSASRNEYASATSGAASPDQKRNNGMMGGLYNAVMAWINS